MNGLTIGDLAFLSLRSGITLASDDMESYTASTALIDGLNSGIGWAFGYSTRNWIQDTEDDLDNAGYTVNATIDGTGYGVGWSGNYSGRNA